MIPDFAVRTCCDLVSLTSVANARRWLCALLSLAAGASMCRGDSLIFRGEDNSVIDMRTVEHSPKAVPLSVPPGQVSTEVRATASRFSYFVYVPKDFAPKRLYPVLFIMSPTGGSAATIEPYIAGAELNDWILAVSVQSANGVADSTSAILAMVDDVSRRLPVDKRRLFATGHSGGARMAFWLAAKRRSNGFGGVLACGAGGPAERLSAATVIYGISGSNCFNRWDMACTFRDTTNRYSRLRFFAGGHEMPPAPLLVDGMCWLNGYGLKSATGSAVEGERETWARRCLERVNALTATQPEEAYELARFLTDVLPPSPARDAAAKQLAALTAQPRIQLYAQGIEQLQRFAMKHLATTPTAYHENVVPPKQKAEAAALATKYADTSLGEIFRRLGEPAVMP